MSELTEFGKELEAGLLAKGRQKKKTGVKPMTHVIPDPTLIAPEAPAPRLEKMVVNHGSDPTRQALAAYEARMKGSPVVDIAHAMGLSLEACKALLREAHDAVKEDLKDNLEANRTLDLRRLDGLIAAYWSPATQGHEQSAYIVLAALKARGKLTGTEEAPDPLRSKQPTNVLVWIQQQLPNINRIVDSLPIE